jgi:CDP-diacylglycerol--glycerol-3-phosphate 3-phosphatidyltransferase
MVIFRTLLGPAVAIVALILPAPQPWLGAMIAAGFVSDVYDGILARRWGTETAALRVTDSAADTVFYLGVLFAVIARHWPVLRDRLGLLIALLVLEAARYLFDWIKYRRIASYHSYASKAWGALMAAATIALLCFDRAFWMVTLALLAGILCDLEGLAMSALLPEWTHDVKTLRRALALRRQMPTAPQKAVTP